MHVLIIIIIHSFRPNTTHNPVVEDAREVYFSNVGVPNYWKTGIFYLQFYVIDKDLRLLTY